jgi:hypothetical protein
MSQKKKHQPGTVAHTCNPSYLGGRDQESEGSQFQVNPGPKAHETPSQLIKSWMQWYVPDNRATWKV